MTHDAPLCAEVLGNFVNAVAAPPSSGDSGDDDGHHPPLDDDIRMSSGGNDGTPAKPAAVTANGSQDNTPLEDDGEPAVMAGDFAGGGLLRGQVTCRPAMILMYLGIGLKKQNG